MNWDLETKPVDIAMIGDLAPVEILYEFDGPRIFSAHSPLGDLLCFLADDDGELRRFIAAPTNGDMLAKLKDGVRSLRDALDQPWVWFVDVDNDDQPRGVWRGTLSDAPPDSLPEPGTMLRADLEPIFALRAIGEGLGEGSVPMSVGRQVMDGATTSLKKIVNVVFEDARRAGRKVKTIRQFYDLPTLGFAYNSFEAAFRMPTDQSASLTGLADESTAAVQEIARKLKQALCWATETHADGTEEGLPLALLEALERLVPPKTGIIHCIEVRGRMFCDVATPYRLTRDASHKVRKALSIARESQEQLITISGRPGEFDKDNLSCTLRETDDDKDHQCRFTPELYDELYEAFDSDRQVTIVGRETLKTGEIEVLIVSHS